MKKKILECDIHGFTLFRCRRKCWKRDSKKDKCFSGEYKEECLKCIEEGRYKKGVVKKRKRNVYVKIK